MTTLASPSWVSHLSRRKLQSVAEDTGDALRRCVLIHNVMRSTASSATAPSPPQLEPQPTPQPQFVFPSMDYSQEQQWLDSLLDDLESDVQVSVVSVDDRHDASECCSSSSVASPSLPKQQQQQPASPPTFESLDSLFYASPDEDEEPSSPPPLEDHDESDDDSDSEASTPTSSTELLGAAPPNGVAPDYFFNNLPYNRLRPPHFDLFY